MTDRITAIATARELLRAESVNAPDPNDPTRSVGGVRFNLPARAVVPPTNERVDEAAELVAIEVDLEFVIAACAALAPMQAVAEVDRQASDPSTVIARALWTAALTIYARCFGGRRTTLTDDNIAALGMTLEHDVFIAQRDQHVAHSVNPLELIQISAVLSLPPIERGLLGVWNSQAAQACGTDDEIAALAALATAALKVVNAKRERAMKDVMLYYLALPLDDLYALETVIARAPEAGELKRSDRSRGGRRK